MGHRHVIVWLAVAFAIACTPYAKQCKVPVLDEFPGLSVTLRSRTYGECVERLRPTIPVNYLLEHENSRVEIAVGERWYPRLYFNPTDIGGSPIGIESSTIVKTSNGPVEIRGRSYAYFLRIDGLDPSHPIEFRLCSASDSCGDKIELRFELVSAYDIELDAV